MGRRQVGIVIIALILLGIAGMAVRLLSVEPELEIIKNIAPLSREGINRVIMRDNLNEVTLRKTGGQWWVGSETFNYPAVETKLAEFWPTVEEINDAELVSRNPENHTLMGVTSEQGTSVEFWRDDQMLEKFLVGDKAYAPLVELQKPLTPWTVQTRSCFLKREGSDDIYQVFCEFPNRFDPDHKMWIDPYISAIPREDVEAITFSYPTKQFDLKVVNTVWMVAEGDSEKRADVVSVQDFLGLLERLIADDFPGEDEAKTLDFNNPNATMTITTRPGASSPPTVLLFIERKSRDDAKGAYYIKNAQNPYVYILEEERADEILITSAELLPEPTPTPTQ